MDASRLVTVVNTSRIHTVGSGYDAYYNDKNKQTPLKLSLQSYTYVLINDDYYAKESQLLDCLLLSVDT